MLPAAAVEGPDFVIATSFCCVNVVVTLEVLFVFGPSTDAVSVVLITALFTSAAVVLGRIAATIVMVLLVAADARLPTKKVKSSGLEALVSDADAGIVIELPFTVALRTRIPSGMLSTTWTPIASEGPLLTVDIV